MRFRYGLVISLSLSVLAIACTPGAFMPVNVGREYGSPKTPLFVSHLPEANQWAMHRTKAHNIFQQILCFDPRCRTMIGRRRVLNVITFKDFKRRIRKNAARGEFRQYAPKSKTPARTPLKPDSIPIKPAVVSSPVVTAEPATGLTPPPVLKSDSLIILNELRFATNSHTLQAAHLGQLDTIAKFLQSHPTLEVLVSGHTDSVGHERHNVILSGRRAEVVAEYLIDHGAPYDNVTFEGFGSAQPLAPNNTAAGRARNRRVQILIRNPKR